MIVLDKYEIIEEIGRGGMGIVYRAKDTRLGRIVALKELVLSQAIVGQDRNDIIARFKQEAQTAANLSHMNVITIFDVGEENNRHFIAMEYLPGKTLKDILDAENKYSNDEIVDILTQIASGLEHAHSRGIVHRDVKPENVKILDENVVKIMDFGIARIESSTSNLTQDGTMLGTLGYISPEQLHNSKGVDTRADIFSFGAMMYEIFTQKLPFDGGTVGSTILKIMTEDPVIPSKINPQIPQVLEQMIMKCLQKAPEKRYQKFRDIVQELQLFKLTMANPQISAPEPVKEAPLIQEQVPSFQQTQYVPPAYQQPQQSVQSPQQPNPVQPSPARFNPGRSQTLPGAPNMPSRRPEPPVSPGMSQSGFRAPADQGRTQFPRQENNTFNRPKTSTSPGVNVGGFNENRTTVNKNLTMSHPGSFGKPVSDSSAEPADFRAAFVRIIGKMGMAKGAFSSPRGIAISSQGMLYVADTQNKRIQVFDSLGSWQFLVQHAEMQSPCDVTVDNNGNIYVIDSKDAKVRVFDPSGKLIKDFGGKGSASGQFRTTSKITCDNNRIYITDTEGYKIHVFNMEGQIQTVYGKYGTKPGEYKSPYGISIDDKRVYILDYGIPRVQVIDKDGISRLVFGQRGTGKGEFSIPKDIAVDRFGRIYVADTLNHRVQVFDSKGKWLYSFGSKGNGQGQFMGPEGIEVSNDGNIFILDKGNNRIQMFTYEV